MRVLLLSIDPEILKDGSRVQERSKKYTGLAHELVYLVFTKQKSGAKKIAENIWVYSTGSNKLLSIVRGFFMGLKIIKKHHIDLVTTYDAFESSLLGYLYKLLTGVKLNIQLHGDFFSNPYWRKEVPLNRLRWHLGLAILKKADSIRAVSQRIKNDLIKRGIAREKITVFPIYTPWENLGLKEPEFKLKERYTQFDFIVLMMGRLERVKRIDIAIKAFSKFVKQNSKSGLLIVGEGSRERGLKNLVNELGLPNSVIFIPWTRDIVSFYKGADCVLLTSEYEGWSRVAIEAMACGCPVIMTDVGCAGEVVKNNENGLVVGVNDRDAIIGALEKLKKSPELRDKFRQKARSALTQLPDKEATLKLYKETWKKAIKK